MDPFPLNWDIPNGLGSWSPAFAPRPTVRIGQVAGEAARVARDESAPTETTTVCACQGAGCNLTPHVQDNEMVKVTFPHDDPVTHGDLGVKGRIGCHYVQNRG